MRLLLAGLMHESNTFAATPADRRRFEQGSLAAGPASNAPRNDRQPRRADGTRSAPPTGPSRLASEAPSRTDPRTTVPAHATFRPLARRSW